MIAATKFRRDAQKEGEQGDGELATPRSRTVTRSLGSIRASSIDSIPPIPPEQRQKLYSQATSEGRLVGASETLVGFFSRLMTC